MLLHLPWVNLQNSIKEVFQGKCIVINTMYQEAKRIITDNVETIENVNKNSIPIFLKFIFKKSKHIPK